VTSTHTSPTFDRLTSEVGYVATDIGMVMMFREGLQPSLLWEILLHNVPAPTLLSQWKTKARERQTVIQGTTQRWVYTDLAPGGPTDLQKKWANRLGLKSYQTPTQRAANPIPCLRPRLGATARLFRWTWTPAPPRDPRHIRDADSRTGWNPQEGPAPGRFTKTDGGRAGRSRGKEGLLPVLKTGPHESGLRRPSADQPNPPEC